MSELKKDEINGEQNVAPVAAETSSEEVKKASESVRKWTSTGLIALYILVAAAVAALIASNVKKALMK